MNPRPRIAIACSGLGRVRRGNEVWAETVANALPANGVKVTLIGGGKNVNAGCPFIELANLSRESRLTRTWLSWHHRYLYEQLSFSVSLVRWLRSNPHDIVHVADPALAARLQKSARSLGIQVVYKDGLLLGPEWCRRFDFVQVLAPYYLEQARAAGVDTARWFVIPHMVDTRQFTPASDRATLRRELFNDRIGPDDFVVMAAGDLSPNSNKRLEWVMEEVSQLEPRADVHLVIAGAAAETDYAAFKHRATALLGDRVHVFANLAGRQMARLYPAADVFAHAALREPFGIVFLEAMASGLPLCGHSFPVTRWIIGDAGRTVDQTCRGELAAVLGQWRQDSALRQELSRKAREGATARFSQEHIAPLYRDAYTRINASAKTGS